MPARPWRWFRIALRWIGFALLILLSIVIWAYRRDRAPASAPMGESISPDEQYQITSIVTSAIELSTDTRAKLLVAHPPVTATSDKTAPGYLAATYRRDVHSKSHGCVAAKFNIADVPEPFNVGLFSKEGEYDAIIRFSSGKSALEPDRPASSNPFKQTNNGKDARGFAIKVLGVTDEKLLDFEQDGTTQDFIMINNPTFFIRTIEEYVAFSTALGAGHPFAYFLPSWKPDSWRLREMRLATATFKPAPASLLMERYYSLSAYALGAQNFVKYGIRPAPANQPLPVKAAGLAQSQIDADYLRLELSEQSKNGQATLDFMMQRQIPGENMPVEDTTVEWSEKASPFIKVAAITLVKGDYNTAAWNERCESLEYNPWHALAEHRPAGVMNRVRKALYQEMSGFRRGKNCQRFCKAKYSGCYQACLDNCPLLKDPPPLDPELAPGVCVATTAAAYQSVGR